MVGSVGTPTNLAVAKYLNGKKVPQLLLVAGSPKLDDPTGLPWTTTFYASQSLEARIYAQHLLASNPNAKVAVLYQNDDFGKGYLAAFRAGLGEKAATMIVKEVSHETTEPTINSQIVGSWFHGILPLRSWWRPSHQVEYSEISLAEIIVLIEHGNLHSDWTPTGAARKFWPLAIAKREVGVHGRPVGSSQTGHQSRLGAPCLPFKSSRQVFDGTDHRLRRAFSSVLPFSEVKMHRPRDQCHFACVDSPFFVDHL